MKKWLIVSLLSCLIFSSCTNSGKKQDDNVLSADELKINVFANYTNLMYASMALSFSNDFKDMVKGLAGLTNDSILSVIDQDVYNIPEEMIPFVDSLYMLIDTRIENLEKNHHALYKKFVANGQMAKGPEIVKVAGIPDKFAPLYSDLSCEEFMYWVRYLSLVGKLKKDKALEQEKAYKLFTDLYYWYIDLIKIFKDDPDFKKYTESLESK